MRAFENTVATKEQLGANLQAHFAADHFRQGRYWEGGKGCAVGCSLVDFGGKPDNHADYERLFGIPRVLARLEDGIFEGLPIEDAKTWPLRFVDAIRPGADLSMVWPRFAVWLLVDNEHGVVKFASEKSKIAIEAVADLYSRQIAGETVTRDQFDQAARYAAAAYAAAYAAADAADAAYAYAAADAAAAYAAADAAAAAYAAADAAAARGGANAAERVSVREDARRIQASKLLELLAAA